MNHHYTGCGRCKHCRVGWSQLCRGGITVFGVTGDGGHAPYMKAPACTQVPLPDELTFEEGAAVSCGTGTAYGALSGSTSRAATRSPSSARARSASPPPCWAWRWARGSSRWTSSPERLDLAAGVRAPTRWSNSRETDPVKAIQELTHGEGAETTMDCTGAARAARGRGAERGHLGPRLLRGRGRRRHPRRQPATCSASSSRSYASWTFSSMGQGSARASSPTARSR